MLPTPAPAGPAPAVVITAEVVAPIPAPLTVLEVVTADAPHARVVAVVLQQGGAVGEEVGMGNAVVFENDALLNLLKEPADGADGPVAAAVVHIGVKPLDLARPVDLLLDHLAGGSDFLGFAGTLRVGAIAGHEKARGGQAPYGIDHLAQGVGATPGDQQDGCVD